MDHFRYQDGELWCERVRVAELAERFGTPLYIYSAQTIRDHFGRFVEAFAPVRPAVRYALKAAGNTHLVRLLASLGAGADVVSIGELERAWMAGVPMGSITFAGVGKTEAELRAALDGSHSPLRGTALAARHAPGPVERRGSVGWCNAESEQELQRLERIASELGLIARAALRVNPNVDAQTHRFTTTGLSENKFGVDIERAPEIFGRFAGSPSLRLAGLHVHIGSPVYRHEPFVRAAEALSAAASLLAAGGHAIEILNLGGGWGADYTTGQSLWARDYAAQLLPILRPWADLGVEIAFEPGRTIVGNAGLLVTRVQYVKAGRARTFAVCDAGMHTLLRPSLYEAFHFIWPARVRAEHVPVRREPAPDLPGLAPCDVVGPVCESADLLAQQRPLPPIAQDDLLAVFTAGAYGMSMSSNYNDHGRPAEVLVEGGRVRCIRRRDTLAGLFEPEFDVETTP
jgi:diaminopimelate decarboxylase